VGELAEPDRRRITVARHTEVQQIAVGEIGAGEHRRHAAVNRVEPVRVAEEVIGRLDEQPMPECLATRCGWISSSQQACTIAR
jgi:hypothetical protein